MDKPVDNYLKMWITMLDIAYSFWHNGKVKTKICNTCGETFIAEKYLYGKCRPCANKATNATRAIRMSNPEYRETYNAKQREYKKRKPRSYAKRKEQWLRYKYNMTQQDYDNLLESQNGVCAICKQVCKSNKMLAIDHDHNCCPGDKSCGQCIRGLLCANCNGAIGMLQEDPIIIKRAMEYISPI